MIFLSLDPVVCTSLNIIEVIMGESAGRLLARLSAGTTNYSGLRGGGVAEFCDAEVAQALAQVSDPAARALMGWKFAGHSERLALALVVNCVVDRWAAEERWQVRRRKGEPKEDRIRLGGPIERMARSSVDEVIEQMIMAATVEMVEPPICEKCKGRGVVWRHPRKGEAMVEVTCDAAGCFGGKVRISDRRRAARCGMSWSMYRRAWSGRYDRVMRLVNRLIVDGLREFTDALGMEDYEDSDTKWNG